MNDVYDVLVGGATLIGALLFAVVAVVLAVLVKAFYALLLTLLIGGGVFLIRSIMGADLEFFPYLRPWFVVFFIWELFVLIIQVANND